MVAHTTSLRAGLAWLKDDFARREDGTVSIETMVLVPVMFWALLVGFSIHDAFRTYGLHSKAAYSIGDAVSRETVPIDDAYFSGALDAFEYLAHSQDKTQMRLSQLWFDADANEYRRDWSQVKGNTISPLTDSEVRLWHSKLPVMPDNERIVLLETWSEYDPMFNIGLTSNDIQTFVFTRPRYAPVVCFDACN